MELEDWLRVMLYVVFQTMGALLSIAIAVTPLRVFWRTLGVLAIAAVLVLPRAYGPAMIFVVQSAFVAMAWSGRTLLRHGRFRDWIPRWRFSLADTFRGGLVLCALLALIRVCWPHIGAVETIEVAALYGLVILSAVWLTFGSGRWPWLLVRSAIMGTIVFSSVHLHLLATGVNNIWSYISADFVEDRLWWFDICWPICLIAVLGCIRVRKWTNSVEPQSRHLKFLRAISTGALFVLGISGGLLALFVGLRLTFLPRLSTDAPVSPNGFDTLEKAGSIVHSPDRWSEIPSMASGDLQKLLDSNAEAIALARTGLQHPWGGSLNHHFSPGEYPEYGAFRDLSRVLALQAEVSARRQKPDQVARSALNGMQIGARLRSRGLLIDALVGNAIENEAVRIFRRHRDSFDAQTCGSVANAIIDLQRFHDTYEAIVERDRIWSMRELGYEAALEVIIDDLVHSTDSDEIVSSTRNALRITDAYLGLLTLDLAIRTFRHEHHHLPNNLNELVPKVIRLLPQDPNGNLPFLYHRKSDTEFVLYGRGPDGDDDGGLMVSRDEITSGANGDIFLDMPDDQSK